MGQESKLWRSHMLYSTKLAYIYGVVYSLIKNPWRQLKILYHGLTVPHFNYGINVQFGAPTFSKKSVNILQKKRSFQTIHNLPHNSHTNSYYQVGHFFKTLELSEFSLGVNIFIKKKSYLFKMDSVFHNYKTRHHNDLILPRHRRQKTKSC